MNLLVVGVNYRTAPVEIRERLAWSGERLNGALEKLSGYVTHGVILSTCNRTEVYTVAEKAAGSRVACARSWRRCVGGRAGPGRRVA